MKQYPYPTDFETDSAKILAKFQYQLQKRFEKEGGELYNSSSTVSIFRNFMHFYFNGGGFDYVHDVVDTRLGKIRRLSELKTKTEDSTFGLKTQVLKRLQN